ncbi:MAG: hypothetical protein ABH950_05565 [Candidatus Altiarchaeota archaeon]
MDDVLAKIREVRNLVYFILLYTASLDFIFSFLVFAIILDLFGVKFLYALVPALFYTVYALRENLKENDVIRDIEANFHGLNERLKTAYDNQGQDNVILRGLRRDVIVRMQSIESNPFINLGSQVKRVFSIVILSFIFLSIGTIEFREMPLWDFLGENPVLNEARDAVNSIRGGIEDQLGLDEDRSYKGGNYSDPTQEETLGAEAGGRKPGISYGPIPGTGGGAGDDINENIFGEASSASLQGQNIDFKLHPEYGGEIEVNEEEQENKPFQEFVLPYIESLEECQECIVGPEHEEIVRRYFEKIAEES